MEFHFLPQEKAAVIFRSLVGQFLTARLNGKIRLPQGDDFFRGVGVLHHQVAGIPREVHRLDRPLRAAADLDHFGDLNEMVLDALGAVETGGSGLLDNLLEIAVIGVAENLGEVSAGPEFPPRFIRAADKLEGRLMPLGWGRLEFIGHRVASFRRTGSRSMCGCLWTEHFEEGRKELRPRCYSGAGFAFFAF